MIQAWRERRRTAKAERAADMAAWLKRGPCTNGCCPGSPCAYPHYGR